MDVRQLLSTVPRRPLPFKGGTGQARLIASCGYDARRTLTTQTCQLPFVAGRPSRAPQGYGGVAIDKGLLSLRLPAESTPAAASLASTVLVGSNPSMAVSRTASMARRGITFRQPKRRHGRSPRSVNAYTRSSETPSTAAASDTERTSPSLIVYSRSMSTGPLPPPAADHAPCPRHLHHLSPTTTTTAKTDSGCDGRGSSLSSSFTLTSAMLALLYPVSNDAGCDGPGP